MQKNQQEPENPHREPHNIRMVIEYDGSRYVGWQRQKNGLSIQEVLESALEQVLKQPVRVSAAGRTDAGVHAMGQVVNFFTGSHLPPRAIERALLPLLPGDIAAHSAFEVPVSFDSRKSARLRWYKFFISNRSMRPAVAANYLTHAPGRLDPARMAAAAAALSGSHDFQAFRAITCTAARTRLDMHPIRISSVDDGILQFDFRCRSFLQNMVRILAGTIISAGRDKISIGEIEEMLRSGKRRNEAVTLAPHGLFLYRVFYPGDGSPESAFVGDESQCPAKPGTQHSPESSL